MMMMMMMGGKPFNFFLRLTLGSFLVTIGAKYFVLKINFDWSALINHMRKITLDQACNDCTKAFDLRPFLWW